MVITKGDLGGLLLNIYLDSAAFLMTGLKGAKKDSPRLRFYACYHDHP
jgi:hypothetical protein